MRVLRPFAFSNCSDSTRDAEQADLGAIRTDCGVRVSTRSSQEWRIEREPHTQTLAGGENRAANSPPVCIPATAIQDTRFRAAARI